MWITFAVYKYVGELDREKGEVLSKMIYQFSQE